MGRVCIHMHTCWPATPQLPCASFIALTSLRLQAEPLCAAANHLQPGASSGADGHLLAAEALRFGGRKCNAPAVKLSLTALSRLAGCVGCAPLWACSRWSLARKPKPRFHSQAPRPHSVLPTDSAMPAKERAHHQVQGDCAVSIPASLLPAPMIRRGPRC